MPELSQKISEPASFLTIPCQRSGPTRVKNVYLFVIIPPAPAYHHRSRETMECNGLQDGKSGKNKGIPSVSGNATGIPDTLLLFALKNPATG
jgi:hypothetical protein